MLYTLVAAALVLHTVFWGAGLAGLAVPRRWRRWWWVFAPGLGLALQSAVVWSGAHSALAGTDRYAWASEVLPAALLAWAGARRRWLRGGPRAALRRLGRTVRGAAAVAGAMLAAGWMLLSPLTVPGRGLTTSSLGSCDQADYAAGARVLQEFARDDRTGFLGLPEVTRVRSADYFFDFWLRLNHFTPAALLAHNAAILGVEPFRLVSVSAVVLALMLVPLVVWLARVAVGVRGGALGALAALAGFSPLVAYGVHHGALGQWYGAQGIALLTLAVCGAMRDAERGGRVRGWLPLMVAAFWLLAGGYNFILLVCLAPAGAWLAALALRRENRPAVARGLGLLAVALGLCAAGFWGRFAGLLERFSLFAQYDFGWAVPLASPETWLGLVRDATLRGWPAGVRVGLSLLLVAGWVTGVRALGRRRPRQAWAAAALVVPVIAGWGVLAWESRVRANASYDAYKLLAVFLPGLLAGWGGGLATWAQSGRRWARGGLWVGFAAVLAANLWAAAEFRRAMAHPPLRVDRQLAALASLERDAQVTSLNLRVEDFWSRLWANAFLLRKPQYFATHTYEGRRNTELKGAWDLSDSLLRALPVAAEDFRIVNERFHAVRVAAPGRIEAGFGAGWQPEERAGGERWRWSGGEGRLELVNPAARPVRATLRLRVHGLGPRALRVQLGGRELARQALDGTLQTVNLGEIALPPGRTVVTFTSVEPPVAPGAGDARLLALALHGFELRALPAVP